MRTLSWTVAFVLFGALAPAAAAADEAPLWLAAGYKALFTCSATFIANRNQEQIARNELTGIYPDYEAPMAKLPPAQVDRQRRWVSVAYDQFMPPRAAFYRGMLGCVLLPPGGGASLNVPDLNPAAVSEEPRGVAWPDGDRLAVPADGPKARSRLGALLKAAFDGESYGEGARTSAVVIASRTRLIAEAYSPDGGVDVPQRTWSAAKSLTGALIGIAVKEGLLRIDEPLGFWPERGDPRAQITIRHLLNMASGLDAGRAGNRTDEIYFGGGLVKEHTLSRELAFTPGRRWTYANNDTMLLSLALRERIHDTSRYLAYPYEKLFRRIGMRHTTAETDWSGTFISSSQVWTTARDLTRFGLLLLNDGMWNGEEVLPRGWVGFMATPAPVQPPQRRSDGTAYPGYGAQTWLYGARHGLPEGTLSAQGNRGQYIVVVPSRGIVIVRRGFDGDGVRFAIDKFSADVLKAVE